LLLLPAVRFWRLPRVRGERLGRRPPGGLLKQAMVYACIKRIIKSTLNPEVRRAYGLDLTAKDGGGCD